MIIDLRENNEYDGTVRKKPGELVECRLCLEDT